MRGRFGGTIQVAPCFVGQPRQGHNTLRQGNALRIKTQKLSEPRSGRNKSRRTPPKTMAPADLAEEVKKMFLFRPLRGLIIFVEVQHRASPDVTISKAYGLFPFYIDS